MRALTTRSFDRNTYAAYLEADTLKRTRDALMNLGDLNKYQKTYFDKIIRYRLSIACKAPKLNKAA
jgi:hypothetical protein